MNGPKFEKGGGFIETALLIRGLWWGKGRDGLIIRPLLGFVLSLIGQHDLRRFHRNAPYLKEILVNKGGVDV